MNKSLSIFEVEEKKNKKYCAIFGNEDDYVEIGYIGDNNYHNIKIAKRQYLRFAGANMHINTIFPNYGVNMKINWDEISILETKLENQCVKFLLINDMTDDYLEMMISAEDVSVQEE